MSDTADFIRNARTKCAMSIRNTAVGDWLGDALRRLEESEAENERLREALEKIVARGDSRGAGAAVAVTVQTLVAVAREALKGGEA